MEMKSVLTLDRLVFDKIQFERIGIKNENEIEFNLQVAFNKRQAEDIYRVSLVLKGNKEKEYTMEIVLSGYFSFDSTEELTEEFKQTLINQNTVAIMMPYMRSQVSLLTAQPEVDCVVLPPFNISKMIEGK